MKVETLLFLIFVIFAKFSQQENLGEEESDLAKSLFVEESQNYIILHVEIEVKEDHLGNAVIIPKDCYKIVNSPKYFYYGDKKLYPGQFFRPVINMAEYSIFLGEQFVVIGKNNQGSLFAFRYDEDEVIAEFKQGTTIIELMNDNKIDELNIYLIKNMLDRNIYIRFAEQSLKTLSKFTQYFEEEIEGVDFISKEIIKPRNQKLFTEIQQFADRIKQYLKDFKELYSEVKKEISKFEKEEEKNSDQ